MPSQKALHSLCGDSAAGALRVGLGCGWPAILDHNDHLSFGPLQPLQSPEQWEKMRDNYWGRFIGDIRNMVEVNGIDAWVAGIHLDSTTGRVWYRSGDALQV